jgi:hypothetical protein
MASSQLSFARANLLLRRAAEEQLKGLGFKPEEELSFAKAVEGGLALINFSTRRAAPQGLWFSFGVGVRFDAVEQILDPEAEDRLMPTVGIPANKLLKSSYELSEWCIDSEATAEGSVARATTAIREHAIPFLERYSSLSEVGRELQSDDPTRWFVLTAEQRIAILATIEFVAGEQEAAIERLRVYLESHPTLPWKRQFRLKQLRERLASLLRTEH